MVHKLLLVLGVVALVGLGVTLSPSGVRAATECNGVVTGTVFGGLVVHSGDICQVENATVSGGIQMDGGDPERLRAAHCRRVISEAMPQLALEERLMAAADR